MKINKQKNGIIAILDALGAASYDDSEISQFLESREIVMKLLSSKSESVSEILSVAKVKTYTFNDTILILLECGNDRPSLKEIQAFVTVLRKFLVDSLERHIIFRGSFAIGSFYEESSTNTILGKAVTDAAAWYDKADWIGLLATPRTTVLIDHLKEKLGKSIEHLLTKYEIPLSSGKKIKMWAVNWPKVFWVKSITPCKIGEKPRETFLKLLGQFGVPFGTESKHFNAISFFDHVVKKLGLKNESPKKSRTR